LTNKSIGEIENTIKKCNEILLQVRAKRIRPGLDDKIITSWNALMIKGYVEAYKVFYDDKFLHGATRCADFMLNNLLKENTLYRIYKNGKVTIPAFAEDHAALCEALISLYEATANEKYLLKAKELMDISIEQFYDTDKNLFYFKSKNDAALIARKIDVNDDVIPSANSIFAKCLFILGFLFDENKYHSMVDNMLITIQAKIEKYPSSYSNWMQLILWKQKGFYQIIVTGKNIHGEMKLLNERYIPNAIKIKLLEASSIPLFTDKKILDDSRIYICKNKVCGLPIKSVEEMDLL
jgi:hypothetical protein